MKRAKSPNQKAFKIVAKKAPVIIPKPTDDELATNIGSEENVSFAMSIALQMKDQQRKADEARKAEAGIVYKKRKDLYEKFAEYIIDVDKQSIEATAKELAKIARNG